MKILTHFEYPPIPIRDFDYQSVTEDYEPGHPIGHGRTAEEAEQNLLEQLDESI